MSQIKSNISYSYPWLECFYTHQAINIGSVSIAAANASTIDPDWSDPITAAGPMAIPDSDHALKVEVEKLSGQVENTQFVNIEVNGENITPGKTYENPPAGINMDRTTTPATQFFSPEVTVTNPAGGAFRYRVWKP